MKPIYLDNKIIGHAFAEERKRVTPITIDQRVLVRTSADENPNVMDDKTFEHLVMSIEKNGFNQSGAIFVPDGVDVREDRIVLGGQPHIVDGTHRAIAAEILNLVQTPWSLLHPLRRGEEKVIRIALNKHRGAIRVDVERRQLTELLHGGWLSVDLLVSGYDVPQLDAFAKIETAEDITPLVIPPPPPTPDDKPTKEAGGIITLEFPEAAAYKAAVEALNRFAKAAKAKGTKPVKWAVAFSKLLEVLE